MLKRAVLAAVMVLFALPALAACPDCGIQWERPSVYSTPHRVPSRIRYYPVQRRPVVANRTVKPYSPARRPAAPLIRISAPKPLPLPHEVLTTVVTSITTTWAALIEKIAIDLQVPLTSRTAIYDVSAHALLLPNGERLEAHSGLGRFKDNPQFAALRFQGPTPPNLYTLRPTTRPFYGVRALHMDPVDVKKMKGRDGILAHNYLGYQGQSQGCMSIKDYQKFLQAYLRGEIDRVVVVDRVLD